MTRDLSTEMFAAVAQPVVQAALLAQFDFDSGTIGMWTGVGNLQFDGDTFTGVGNLCGISGYTERQNLQAEGMTFELSGISSELLSTALDEDYQGRQCRLWLSVVSTTRKLLQEDAAGAILQEDGSYLLLESELITSPYRFFTGLMDTMVHTESGETATLQLQAENVLALLDRTKERRYTPEDQKAKYPGDKGLDFIPTLKDKQVLWGR